MYGGNNNFAPADTATIMPTEEGIKPKGIHFLDTSVPQTVKHVRFEGSRSAPGRPGRCNGRELLVYRTQYPHRQLCHRICGVEHQQRGAQLLLLPHTHLSAIGAGSNLAAGVVIEDNVFEDCSTDNRNYPVINETLRPTMVR